KLREVVRFSAYGVALAIQALRVVSKCLEELVGDPKVHRAEMVVGEQGRDHRSDAIGKRVEEPSGLEHGNHSRGNRSGRRYESGKDTHSADNRRRIRVAYRVSRCLRIRYRLLVEQLDIHLDVSIARHREIG